MQQRIYGISITILAHWDIPNVVHFERMYRDGNEPVGVSGFQLNHLPLFPHEIDLCHLGVIYHLKATFFEWPLYRVTNSYHMIVTISHFEWFFQTTNSLGTYTPIEGENKTLLLRPRRFAVCDCLCIIECSAFVTIPIQF